MVGCLVFISLTRQDSLNNLPRFVSKHNWPILQKLKLNHFLQYFCLNSVFPMCNKKLSDTFNCFLFFGLLLEVSRYLAKWLLESFTPSTNILGNDSAQGALHSQAGTIFKCWFPDSFLMMQCTLYSGIAPLGVGGINACLDIWVMPKCRVHHRKRVFP